MSGTKHPILNSVQTSHSAQKKTKGAEHTGQLGYASFRMPHDI